MSVIPYLIAINVLATLLLGVAFVRVARLRVERTISGRASLGLLATLLVHSIVGLMRRAGWEYWVEAQALAWTIAAGTALGITFTRSHEHRRDDTRRIVRMHQGDSHG